MEAKNIKLQIGIPPKLKTAYQLGFSGQRNSFKRIKFIIKDCELGGFFPFVSIQIVEDKKKLSCKKVLPFYDYGLYAGMHWCDYILLRLPECAQRALNENTFIDKCVQ